MSTKTTLAVALALVLAPLVTGSAFASGDDPAGVSRDRQADRGHHRDDGSRDHSGNHDRHGAGHR